MLRLSELLALFKGNGRLEIYGRNLLFTGVKEEILKSISYTALFSSHYVKAVNVVLSIDKRSPIFQIYLDD